MSGEEAEQGEGSEARDRVAHPGSDSCQVCLELSMRWEEGSADAEEDPGGSPEKHPLCRLHEGPDSILGAMGP